ncbi:transposase [Kocuria sp. UCD-OTCP]|uniref:transposase n=1 Tax=Kocuria sp. UCD-OTCP TaxID=1292021 RepID=UPI0009D9FB5F
MLRTTTASSFQRAWAELEEATKDPGCPKVKSLVATLRAWSRPLLTFCRTRVTNDRIESANMTANNLERIGRNYTNYLTRILSFMVAQQAS